VKNLIYFAILSLVGCSSPQQANYYQPPPTPLATDGQISAANERSLHCLAKYSVLLDDRSTDINVIAKAAANSCRNERENFISISTQGRGALDFNRIRSAIFEKDIESSIFYILSNRRLSKK
jgi:hypothetical protein